MSQQAETEWKGRIVLVIGGNEVGTAIAEGFRNQGAEVAIISDAADMTDLAVITSKVDTIIAQFGQIDILVHAWEVFAQASALEMPPQQWKDIVQGNIKSKFLYAKEVGKHMLEQEQGNIIFLSSISGIVAAPGAIAFAASQGAIHQIARTLSVEWAKRGIRVNAIASTLPEGTISNPRIAQVTPLERIPKAEELVGTVLYLASNASQMVTGQIISVDGGYVAQ
ncbi:SDR family oxidoreductase [Paenibacillus psychroresistens]|uniref:SDR family oxidoreductase n=1 Tax=Paenibacillus psychroresistens TaxID=1778678 RepID=A0A6B8RFU5_9BACL|nr:SDR family oxidoreductase [Paenibacillus psychroresistens]QGQ94298.1 SDR family oxidoreductase [Paenibacillus psychroresistens]